MIRQATATVGETEEVGAEIVENLGKNREKISSTQSKVMLWPRVLLWFRICDVTIIRVS